MSAERDDFHRIGSELNELGMTAEALEDKERFSLGKQTVLSRWRERYSRMFGEVVA